MLGGSVLLVLLVAGSAAWLLASLLGGGSPPPPAVAVLALTLLYAVAARPWLRRWGSTPAERERPLPGDELSPAPGRNSTRAVTIAAPPERVWPWLAQLGQDRGGFYSYAWLENLAGCRLENADRIHPEWQHRRVGETVLLHPLNGLRLTLFEPNRAYGLEGWGVWVLEPGAGGDTRLIARGHGSAGLAQLAYTALLEIPHFLMERKMLLGIKQRAERAEAGG
jgi:hypothetical protein